MSQENIFDLVQDRQTAIIFDGANMYATLRAADWAMDFIKLKSHVEDLCECATLDYFTAVSNEEGYSPVQPLIDLLAYNGFRTITKPTQVINDGENKRFKGNVSVNIAVHVMNMLNNGGLKHLVLFAGDGDYTPLVSVLRDRNIRVTIVSSIDCVSDDLRRSCNEFVDVKNLKPFFERTPQQ